ncbi:uncharacterized protein BT62DRAFT_953537 [Guyanagaster necrorhizus]|uniref:Uncharacterized protein n=1 Tax=Guyanagaster necrorhizus TaxID=856835 RepID=A0A9P8APV5_9AGAR|nr:uncharacterized protein BT62DRAFT_953537 [Guyanagaster necrorhizus MCA 3950]KAG7443404.1 hypothetical protein BT62DRAFT_953537 [Guyanagaster necrorhizus MCA 3950]
MEMKGYSYIQAVIAVTSVASLCFSSYFFLSTFDLLHSNPPHSDIIRLPYGRRDHTFISDDVPLYFPSQAGLAAMFIEETVHYSFDDAGYNEWWIGEAEGNGTVRLGPQNRLFSVSFWHQLHCLRVMHAGFKAEVVSLDDLLHAQHCLNLLRQWILCHADTALEPNDFTQRNFKYDRGNQLHVCNDWDTLYAEVSQNWHDWVRTWQLKNFNATTEDN